MRNPYKAVNPDQRIRDLRKDFKAIQQGNIDPERDRGEFFTDFIRRAHAERQLNMVMHAAQELLDEDPEGLDRLVQAYLDVDDDEERLRSISELQNLSRWIGNGELNEVADRLAEEQAPAWVAAAEGGEQRRRLRDLASIFDREFADRIRDRFETF